MGTKRKDRTDMSTDVSMQDFIRSLLNYRDPNTGEGVFFLEAKEKVITPNIAGRMLIPERANSGIPFYEGPYNLLFLYHSRGNPVKEPSGQGYLDTMISVAYIGTDGASARIRWRKELATTPDRIQPYAHAQKIVESLVSK